MSFVAWSWDTISQGCRNFPTKKKKKNCKPSQNSRRQRDDVNQVPYGGPTNITRQRTKFGRHGDWTPGVCALVLATPGVWHKYSDHDVLKRWYKLLNTMKAHFVCCTVGCLHCMPIKTPDLISCTLIPQWWNWNSEFWWNCLNES